MISTENLCPTCGDPATWQCRCLRADKACGRGHHWHHCPVHNRLVLGKSDHSREDCSCRPTPDPKETR